MLDNIANMTDSIIKWISSDAMWVSQVFVVILAALVLAYIVSKAISNMRIKAKKTKNPWDDALFHAAKRPIKAFIWIVGLTFALEIIHLKTGADILTAAYPMRDVGVIATLCWFVIRFVSSVENYYLNRDEESIDPTTVGAVGKILRAAVIITAILIVLQTLGFSVSGVLAFGGVGGIAIGFAAKDLLANFFGALMIYFDKPFKVGDWIRSPDRDIEGTVEHIGWRQIRIRTFDKRPLYVPNAMFSTIAVENPSRMQNRRIYETVGVRYDDAAVVGDIVADVKQMLREHPEIDTNQTLIVNVNKFAPSSIDFFVYTFTKTTDWITFHDIKQDIMLKIIEIIDKHHAQIAFPTSTLHIADKLTIEGSAGAKA
tara:strand:+ start:506 stop:1618 length:1113 start_codon:yes stop_codon:yes gene_type:complete